MNWLCDHFWGYKDKVVLAYSARRWAWRKERPMSSLLEILTYFDWTMLPRVAGESLAHADWKGAWRRGGLGGVIGEGLGAITGANSYPFFVPANGPSGDQISRLLRAKGIKSWGYAWARGEMFFQVPARQGAWAAYVLQGAGVPLLHRVPAGQPGEGLAARAARGKPGKQAKTESVRSLLDRIADWLP